MFTEKELNQNFNGVNNYTSNDTEITFALGDREFELQSGGLLTLLPNDMFDKKECHFKIKTMEDLVSAINTIDDWNDDWND